MHLVWFVVGALLLSCCASQQAPSDKNDKWRRNDVVLKQIDNFYNSLAIYVEDEGNQEKRFVSIVSLGVYMYVKSKLSDDTERAEEAVNKTREQLQQPADVIASPFRSLLVLLQSVIEQPLTDVKASCPPNATQSICDSNLKRIRNTDEESCHGYQKNVELDNLLTDTHASSRHDFLKDMARASRGTDEQALSFFQTSATGTYRDLFKYVNRVYKKLLYGTFPCRYPLILFKS